MKYFFWKKRLVNALDQVILATPPSLTKLFLLSNAFLFGVMKENHWISDLFQDESKVG